MESVREATQKTSGKKRLLPRIVIYVSIALGIVIIAGATVLYTLPDSFYDGILKSNITKAFQSAYPQYSLKIARTHYKISANVLECDSLSIEKPGDPSSYNIDYISLNGIDRVALFFNHQNTFDVFARSEIDIKGITVDFPKSQYKIRCSEARLSIADSTIVADTAAIQPETNDAHFFATSSFRKTRFLAVIPGCIIRGIDFQGMLRNSRWDIRYIEFQRAMFNVMMDKEKPANPHASNPLTPEELLRSIAVPLRIDSFNIIDGKLRYFERFKLDAQPAELRADSVQMTAACISNRGDSGESMVFRAQGRFMDACIMKLRFEFPLSTPAFTFQYSGSCDRMDLSHINLWLEPAEYKRIKSGVLQSAVFHINVINGKAAGSVKAQYDGLALAALDENLHEEGLFQRFVSFLANMFKIRGSNEPDKNGMLKIGMVKATKKPDDAFFKFIWIALRGGLGDIVGFK